MNPTSRGPARRTPRGRGSSSSLWFFVGGVAVVVVIGIVAIALTRGSDDDGGSDSDPSEVAANVSLDGQALPVLGDGEDPAVGTRAPVARGVDFDGTQVTIGDGGAPQIVIFLAHWCPHCQAEVPRIVALAESGGIPPAVEVVAVATGTSADRPNYPPSTWLERERWPFPVMLDTSNGSVANAYGVSGFPFFVVLDAEGMVLARGSGEQSEAALRELVSTALDSMSEPDEGDDTDGDDEQDSTSDTGGSPTTAS